MLNFPPPPPKHAFQSVSLSYTMCISCFFISDGCSFHYAHICSKPGISICLRHLVTSIESSNPIFFPGNDLFYITLCATSSELPSYIRNMVYIRFPNQH